MRFRLRSPKPRRTSQPRIPQHPYEEMIIETIRNRAFATEFQPVINHQDGSVVFYEALSRIRYRDEAISPEVFFRASIDCGYHLTADFTAMRCALENFQTANLDKSTEAVVSVNAMPVSLKDPIFFHGLKRLLNDLDFPPERLVVEILEFDYMSLDEINTTIHELQKVGVGVAIDDFGSKGSTLLAVSDCEPNYIKLDRTLVRDVSSCEKRKNLLSAVLSFVSEKVTVIAEGVETVDDLVLLESMGIFCTQGYLWTKPVDVKHVEVLQQHIEDRHNTLLNLAQDEPNLTNQRILKASQQFDNMIAIYNIVHRYCNIQL